MAPPGASWRLLASLPCPNRTPDRVTSCGGAIRVRRWASPPTVEQAAPPITIGWLSTSCTGRRGRVRWPEPGAGRGLSSTRPRHRRRLRRVRTGSNRRSCSARCRTPRARARVALRARHGVWMPGTDVPEELSGQHRGVCEQLVIRVFRTNPTPANLHTDTRFQRCDVSGATVGPKNAAGRSGRDPCRDCTEKRCHARFHTRGPAALIRPATYSSRPPVCRQRLPACCAATCQRVGSACGAM